jgi:hypothetical protein
MPTVTDKAAQYVRQTLKKKSAPGAFRIVKTEEGYRFTLDEAKEGDQVFEHEGETSTASRRRLSSPMEPAPGRREASASSLRRETHTATGGGALRASSSPSTLSSAPPTWAQRVRRALTYKRSRRALTFQLPVLIFRYVLLCILAGAALSRVHHQ